MHIATQQIVADVRSRWRIIFFLHLRHICLYVWNTSNTSRFATGTQSIWPSGQETRNSHETSRVESTCSERMPDYSQVGEALPLWDITINNVTVVAKNAVILWFKVGVSFCSKKSSWITIRSTPLAEGVGVAPKQPHGTSPLPAGSVTTSQHISQRRYWRCPHQCSVSRGRVDFLCRPLELSRIQRAKRGALVLQVGNRGLSFCQEMLYRV